MLSANRLLTTTAVAAAVLALALQAQAADLVVIVSSKTKIDNVSKTDLKNFFLGKRKTWDSGDKVVPINLPAKTPGRLFFDARVLDMTAEQVGRYWVGQKIRAKAKAPKAVPSADLVKRLVASIPGAVGYIPATALDGSVRAISIDGVVHTKPTYPLTGD